MHRPWNRLSALNFAGGWFQLKIAYDSSVIRSPGTPIRVHTPVRQNRLAAPTRGGIKDSSPGRHGQPSPPETQDRGCRPCCDFYWTSWSPRSACPSSSLMIITSVTNDSISIHICSDWSMRETIVSGVSCAPTAQPTASLATPHLAQTKSVCFALSTRTVAVTIRLAVSFLEALQIRIKTTMARKRLRWVKADLTVLSIQPGGELRD